MSGVCPAPSVTQGTDFGNSIQLDGPIPSSRFNTCPIEEETPPDDCVCPPGPAGPTGPAGIPGPEGIQGEQGLPGVDGIDGAGNVSWKGCWEIGVAYLINDLISDDDSSFMCITDHTSDVTNQPDRDLDVCPGCLLYTSPSPRDRTRSRMPSSA